MLDSRSSCHTENNRNQKKKKELLEPGHMSNNWSFSYVQEYGLKGTKSK